MTRADVIAGCSASQGGVPGAAAVPGLPSEAWALLSTARVLPTTALGSCSTRLCGGTLAEGQTSGVLSERILGRGAGKRVPSPEQAQWRAAALWPSART